jgi:hypothetical protein
MKLSIAVLTLADFLFATPGKADLTMQVWYEVGCGQLEGTSEKLDVAQPCTSFVGLEVESFTVKSLDSKPPPTIKTRLFYKNGNQCVGEITYQTSNFTTGNARIQNPRLRASIDGTFDVHPRE